MSRKLWLSLRRLLQVHSSGDRGSPRVSGSTSERRSSSKLVSVSLTGLRPPPENGYSVLRGDWTPETHSVGVPLFRDKDGECFAINCRVPIFRLRGNQIEEEVAPRRKSLANSIRMQFLAGANSR